ncbi:hypothetical protein A3F34_00065 [Candidatus Roizmanbacteria bacterium RIFCSPHIGHO2_12_FULL_44_10]|uniref:Toxin n=1 Tax=Candidatus Roizmanbacteria bacterium RIFCSPHIGHO2_12_FULL_44_10 TaxID=1802054 RepID=A0A1F7I504_9BACT|nr:MAG: hypothetical protein A3F34_00065 [Candidatus Roizmanbacteria bacterium RIFCSPHIGHO2_12_FULL_44_10]
MRKLLFFTSIQSFEWDEANIKKNWKKHRISDEESEQVFYNKPQLISRDKKHSKEERRYHSLGKSDSGRLIFISFTIRDRAIRIISARPQNKKERSLYEETKRI